MSEIVSVCVISYNSERTIIETLNSVLNQTYKTHNIELIIADDCSKDSTVSTVEEWLSINAKLFYKASVYRNEQNKGISANCNLAWRNACGKWIKTIAADDMLMDDCIFNNIEYLRLHKNVDIVFSDVFVFSNDKSINTLKKHNKKILSLDSNNQLKALLSNCFLFAPSSFIKNSALKDIGYANEKYRMIEDYPLWLKFLKKGYTLHYLEKPTVYYRCGDSLSQSKSKIANIDYLNSFYDFKKECIWPELPWFCFLIKWDDYIIYNERRLWVKIIGNKMTTSYIIYHYTLFLIRPYRVFNKYLSRWS